jgi:hypothetical protein
VAGVATLEEPQPSPRRTRERGWQAIAT